MADNQYINKVVYGNQTLIDLTSDTITANDLLANKTAHSKSGAPITGTMPNIGGVTIELDKTTRTYTIPKGYHNGTGSVSASSDLVDTTDATALAGEILAGQTAYINGTKVTGTMANKGAYTGTISTLSQVVSIPVGYHDGSGSVSISAVEQSKLIASNIREGITILGVLGTMSGSEEVRATTLSATAYTTSKTYLPSDLGDYNYFSEATVAAIAYSETDNSSGGKTVTIGTVAPT